MNTEVHTDASRAIADLWAVNNPTGTTGLIGIDKLGDAIRFFDPVSLEEQKVIPHKNHHEVAISPDHRRAFASEFGKSPPASSWNRGPMSASWIWRGRKSRTGSPPARSRAPMPCVSTPPATCG